MFSDLTLRVLLKRSNAQKTWPTNGILTYLARLVLPTACQVKRKRGKTSPETSPNPGWNVSLCCLPCVILCYVSVQKSHTTMGTRLGGEIPSV